MDYMDYLDLMDPMDEDEKCLGAVCVFYGYALTFVDIVGYIVRHSS